MYKIDNSLVCFHLTSMFTSECRNHDYEDEHDKCTACPTCSKNNYVQEDT